MSKARQLSRRYQFERTIAVGLLLIVATGWLLYLAYLHRTSYWIEAQSCAVVSSRLVPAGITSAGYRNPIIVYRGEYGVEYEVRGKQYFTWADSGWADQDKEWIKERVSDLTIDCPVRVRYNPLRPEESVASLRRR